jgi:hypothetical protein
MHPKLITPSELASRGRALYGQRWQTALAEDLAINDRTMRRWLSGESPIPDNIEDELRQILERRLHELFGLIGYSVNLSDGTVLHYPTYACFRIEADGTLTVLFDKLIPPDQCDLIKAGAEEALRRERERDPRVVGRFA